MSSYKIANSKQTTDSDGLPWCFTFYKTRQKMKRDVYVSYISYHIIRLMYYVTLNHFQLRSSHNHCVDTIHGN